MLKYPGGTPFFAQKTPPVFQSFDISERVMNCNFSLCLAFWAMAAMVQNWGTPKWCLILFNIVWYNLMGFNGHSMVCTVMDNPKLHPYAQVLAMFAFDSYSQSKRSPRPLSRHRPCKTPFPIGNASFNKPWPNYHGSIMFYSFLIESHRNAGFQRAFFRGHCWRPQTKTRSRPFS